jgi:secreted trypsin-like serine protease
MKLLVTSYLLLTMLLGADARLDGTQAPGKRVHHEHEVAESRIVGGNAASVGEYLYFVSWNGCAASLIAEDVILSAAHCAGIRSDNVIVGAHQKWWGQTSGDAEKRTISERRIHPEYASNTFTNDFIVMKLTDPVTHIDPVILNFDAASPTEDETLTAIGFGSLRQGGWTPRLLQEVAVQYVSHDQCNAEYDGDIIEDVMLCAGVTGGGKDSCQGDSGGPIVRKTDEGHIQVGVVSWGYGW